MKQPASGSQKRTTSTASNPHSKRGIAAYYRALGWSQEDAATKAGCRREQISRWERGADAEYWNYFDEARRQILREGFGPAWQKLLTLLDSPFQTLQLQAASKIIDAVSKDYPSKHEVTGADGGPIEERRFVLVKPVLAEEGEP